MNIIKSREPDQYFVSAIKLYQSTFPYDIQEPVEVFHHSFELKSQNEDAFHFASLIINEETAGFISYHLDVEAETGYYVYLVVDPKYRGQGLAERLISFAESDLKEICAKYDHTLHNIFLECEKNNAGESPLEPFYNKFQFEKFPVDYYQPGLHNDAAVPMNLFVKSFREDSTYHTWQRILSVYDMKYTYCNHIDRTVLDNIEETMSASLKREM